MSHEILTGVGSCCLIIYHLDCANPTLSSFACFLTVWRLCSEAFGLCFQAYLYFHFHAVPTMVKIFLLTNLGYGEDKMKGRQPIIDCSFENRPLLKSPSSKAQDGLPTAASNYALKEFCCLPPCGDFPIVISYWSGTAIYDIYLFKNHLN